MPFRAWCLAVALGLIAGSLQAQEQTGKRSERATLQQNTDQAFGLPVRIIEDEEVANAAERREAEAHKWQYEGLLVQKSMEAAAHSTKCAAWLSSIAVAIGTVFLIWNLILMRETNKSAREAVAVTREVARDQSRAYVHVTKVHWRESGDQFEFAIFVANGGQTPAKRFHIGATLEVQTFGSAPVGEIDKNLPLVGWSALPGQDVLWLRYVPIAIPDFTTIAARNLSQQYIILRGRLRYETIYGEIFETEFSFMGRGRGTAQPQYAEHGDLGTKMSRSIEEVQVFEIVSRHLT